MQRSKTALSQARLRPEREFVCIQFRGGVVSAPDPIGGSIIANGSVVGIAKSIGIAINPLANFRKDSNWLTAEIVCSAFLQPRIFLSHPHLREAMSQQNRWGIARSLWLATLRIL